MDEDVCDAPSSSEVHTDFLGLVGVECWVVVSTPLSQVLDLLLVKHSQRCL